MHENLENKLAALFALSRDGVLGIRNGTISFANPAAAALFGRELTGTDASALLPDYIINGESPQFTASLEVEGTSLFLSGVQAEDLLLLTCSPAQPNDNNLSALAASVGYALNSSIGTLRLSMDQLTNRMDLQGDEKAQTYASVLYHSYYTLLRTSRNLTTASALASGDAPFSPKLTDLITLCSQLMDSLSPAAGQLGIEIRQEYPEGRLPMSVDREKFEQMLLNLISNSLHSMPQGGTLRIALKKRSNRLILTLEDSGSGIPPSIMQHIFSSFDEKSFSALAAHPDKGVGLGLCVARGIVELHRGVMLIESKEGRGTRIQIMLPATLEASSRFHSAETPYRLSGMNTILTELSTVLPSSFYVPQYFD